MSILTLLKYLFGSRRAILTIAGTPAAVGLGAIFVLSAAFAREYDGQDLLAEPWHLLVPFVASLATSFVLFCLVYAIATARVTGSVPFWRTYRAFLSLYWLTAPLAWLYAIPVERFMSAGDAMATNLELLGVVALWRVVLMIRVVGVLFNTHPLAPLWPVMLFGDSIALAIVFLTPLPIFNIMGGVRIGEREQVIISTAFIAGFIGVVTWLLWFLGTMIVFSMQRTWQLTINFDSPRERVRRSLWAFAVCAVLIWLPVLTLTQPEQQLRHSVERDFKVGNYDEALKTISERGLAAFPPHWEPPPNVSYPEAGQPALLEVMEFATRPEVPAWLQNIYLAKLDNQMSNWGGFSQHRDDLPRLRTMVERTPQGKEVVRRHAASLRSEMERWVQDSNYAESAAAAEALLNWSGVEATTPATNE